MRHIDDIGYVVCVYEEKAVTPCCVKISMFQQPRFQSDMEVTETQIEEAAYWSPKMNAWASSLNVFTDDSQMPLWITDFPLDAVYVAMEQEL